MLLATTSETITNPIELQNFSTLAAAHGQTLTIDTSQSSTFNGFSGRIFLGVPGDDGTIGFKLGPSGYGNPTFVVQAGTVLDAPGGMIGGWPLTVEAGGTFDLNGQTDQTGTLSGNGVLTNSGTAALFGLYQGNFAGLINGAIRTDFLAPPA